MSCDEENKVDRFGDSRTLCFLLRGKVTEWCWGKLASQWPTKRPAPLQKNYVLRTTTLN
jgi:hypothetical protein